MEEEEKRGNKCDITKHNVVILKKKKRRRNNQENQIKILSCCFKKFKRAFQGLHIGKWYFALWFQKKGYQPLSQL